MYVKFLQDVVDVVLHRGGLDEQSASDLFVAVAIRHELQDFALTMGERVLARVR